MEGSPLEVSRVVKVSMCSDSAIDCWVLAAI